MMEVIVALTAAALAVAVGMLVLLARQVEVLRANMLATNRELLELRRRLEQYGTELALW